MKKETLEEVVERQFPIIKELEHSIEYKASIAERKLAFMFGAKWQYEQFQEEIRLLREELEFEKRKSIVRENR